MCITSVGTVDCENETVTELVVDMEQLDKEKNEKKVAKTTHEFNSSEETSGIGYFMLGH